MVFHRIFKEPREGYVAHTAASRRIREDPNTRDGLGYMFDEIWPSYAHTVPALERWRSEMPNETGWNHYHNSDKRFYEYYHSHPDMAQRFAGAMASFVNAHGNAPSLLAEHCPWETIGKGTVVDVGGSKGHIIILLAQRFPSRICPQHSPARQRVFRPM
ncbi:hypothetical protein BJX68DRAFT_265051 [Aspergillus pseudodeflectus]|uniref:O-methyltransferase domain-containing protein n=1 Tax=Aspergillus pseudodeflectus TaxID=176178 RepID=A0ABR4KMU3_9EURO